MRCARRAAPSVACSAAARLPPHGTPTTQPTTPPEPWVAVVTEGDVADRLAALNHVRLGEIGGLPVDFLRFALGVDELVERAGDPGAGWTAILEESGEALRRARQDASELQRRPADANHRRRVQVGSNIEQADELIELARQNDRLPLSRPARS